MLVSSFRMAATKHTALASTILSGFGAVFGTLDGYEAPLHYGGWLEEYQAVRNGVGLFDAGFRSLWCLVGADRVSFLQGMVTADVAKLDPGSGTYAAAVTVQGRLVTDLRIFSLPEEVWLDVPATHATKLREHLEKYIVADDVEFREPGDSGPVVLIEGRKAGATVAELFGPDVARLPLFGHTEVTFEGCPLRVVFATHTGEPGYLVFGPRSVGPKLWQGCVAAGAKPAGMQALQTLRIEAGIPWTGSDLDEEILIAEAEIESAISYGKGCYLGQEVVERVAARGQVQRRRVGFLSSMDDLPVHGSRLFSGGREVGFVTSAAWSPLLQKGVGFAYVRREFWTPGTRLEVDLGARRAAVEVAHFPFLDIPVICSKSRG